MSEKGRPIIYDAEQIEKIQVGRDYGVTINPKAGLIAINVDDFRIPIALALSVKGTVLDVERR